MDNEYKGIACLYDLLTMRALAPARALAARLAAESGAQSVLDIGCGTGLQILEFERRGLVAAGVDSSPAMLAAAERRLGGKGQLFLASGAALPFAADVFDLAMFSLVLHESAEDPFCLLDEALRVAPRVYALDWGLAERNLDYPARAAARLVERMAGRRHYAAYGEYMRRGALEGLMERYRRSRGARVAWRRHICLHTMLLMQVERA